MDLWSCDTLQYILAKHVKSTEHIVARNPSTALGPFLSVANSRDEKKTRTIRWKQAKTTKKQAKNK